MIKEYRCIHRLSNTWCMLHQSQPKCYKSKPCKHFAKRIHKHKGCKGYVSRLVWGNKIIAYFHIGEEEQRVNYCPICAKKMTATITSSKT